MNFILEQILFYFAIIVVLFLPGWFLLLALFREKTNKLLSPIEKFVVSFGLSIVTIDFLMISIGKIGIPFTRESILIAIGLFIIICLTIAANFKIKKFYTIPRSRDSDTRNKTFFSKNQTILIVLILFLTIFIKTAYLKDTIFPTSTDLGHHMYWAKLVSQTGELPTYEKLIIPKNTESYELVTEKIADFIIGEHLIFSAINLISGIAFISYFPTLILLLVNIMGLLAIFILTLKLFENYKFNHWKLFRNSKLEIRNFKNNIAIISLFLIGPLYSLASPQAKYVSGGVVGNIMGNLLIPLALYFYFRAFKNPTKKTSRYFLLLGLFTSMGLFYTHHLSGLVFLFIVFFMIAIFVILLIITYVIPETSISQQAKRVDRNAVIRDPGANTNSRFRISDFLIRLRQKKNLLSGMTIGNIIKNYAKLTLSPSIIIFLLIVTLYVLFIYTPSYLNYDTTGTAIGTPSKSTRTGLTITQFKYAVGEPRLALGLIGLVILSFQIFRRKYFKLLTKNATLPTTSYLLLSTLLGWALAVSLMTIKPHWLYVNIPSGRVSNYASFPFIITASFAIVWILYFFKNTTKLKLFMPTKITLIFITLIFVTFFSAGYYDNSQSLTDSNSSQSALKTFHASKYLATHLEAKLPSEIMVFKDHNYIKSTALSKLFFMKDYSYPLSRGYFKRYNDPVKPREMCTLWMIESPTSENAQKCYEDTKTKFIMINPEYDSIQFEKSNKFWKTYSVDKIGIFYKK